MSHLYQNLQDEKYNKKSLYTLNNVMEVFYWLTLLKKLQLKRINMFKDKLMVGKENKKLIFGVLLTFIVCMGSAILALDYPNPGHPANEIGPGTFNTSGVSDALWYFPALLYTEYLKVYDSHNPSFVVTGNTSLGNDSSDKTTVKGDLDVSGDIQLGSMASFKKITNGYAFLKFHDPNIIFHCDEMIIDTVGGGLIPGTDNRENLGYPSKRWERIYGVKGFFDNLDVSGNTQLGDSSSDKVKAYKYCDESGNNCHDASSGWATGGGGCCSLLDTLNNNSDASGFTGTTTLGGDLDVTEGVKVGDSSTTCNSSTEGTVKYNYVEHRLEVCDSNNWVLASGEVPCNCPGTGYKTYNIVNGDTVYVDCNANKCWTPTQGSYNWPDAKSRCSGLTYGRFTDWVLPDKTTLQNLCNSGSCSGSCFGGDGSTYYYWSSTEYSSGRAYKVDFYNCDLHNDYKIGNSEYVRCVRG